MDILSKKNLCLALSSLVIYFKWSALAILAFTVKKATIYFDPNNPNIASWECEDVSWAYPVLNAQCFTEETFVWDAKGNKKTMEQLSIGDEILDGDNNPTRVIGFLHKVDSSEENTTIKFFSDEDELFLEVTPNHLLFDSDGNTRFAHDFEIGNYFRPTESQEDIIAISNIEISSCNKKLIAPLTESGTIKVGDKGVRASCYANFNHQSLSHIYCKTKHMISPYNKNGDLSQIDMFMLSCMQRLGLAE